jgi:hypothetical protein
MWWGQDDGSYEEERGKTMPKIRLTDDDEVYVVSSKWLDDVRYVVKSIIKNPYNMQGMLLTPAERILNGMPVSSLAMGDSDDHPKE